MTGLGTSFISIKWLSDRVILSVLLTLLLFLSADVRAQVLQPRRFEIPIGQNETNFEIIPAQDEGLFLYRAFTGTRSGQLHLIHLDTAFAEKWSGFLPVEKNYFVIGKKAYNSQLYLLLRYKDYSKNDFILIIVDGATGNYTRRIIKGYIPFSPTEFQVARAAVLIGGYYNKVPIVLHFSLANFQSRVLPGIFNESGELNQIRVNEDGNFDVLISALNFQKQRTLWVKNYDVQGNLLRNFTLDVQDNRHLIFGRSLKATNDIQIIAGVYGSRSAEFSRGIFIASIDPSGLQKIRYYNFGDLENFFKYMKAKREKRVKDRIERRKIKGKKIKFNYRFLVHELVSYKDQFVLLGEAFYPKYSSVSPYGSFFSPIGRPANGMIQNGRIFEGYFYTHAVVMGFTPEGNLLWDNSFEINDVRTFTLEQFVKLDVDNDEIALLYLYENQLRTKLIRDNDVIEGKTTDPIITGSVNDVVKKSGSTNKLEYWYSEYLYAYGVQEIESQVKGQRNKRVFYINKVKHVD